MKWWKKKEVRRPTAAGWGLLAAAGLLFLVGLRLAAPWMYDALALHRPVEAELGILEGWVPDYGAEALRDRLRAPGSPLRRVYTTGGPVERGSYLIAYGDYASLTAASLEAMGVDPALITPVPAEQVGTDRTYASALALKAFFDAQGLRGGRVDLYTLGPHARRSRYLFQKALGPSFEVGSVCIPHRYIHRDDWWTTSEGAKMLLTEWISNLYTLLFF